MQTVGGFIDDGMDARVLHRTEHLPVTFACHDGMQDALTRLANHVGVTLVGCMFYAYTVASHQNPTHTPFSQSMRWTRSFDVGFSGRARFL